MKWESNKMIDWQILRTLYIRCVGPYFEFMWASLKFIIVFLYYR